MTRIVLDKELKELDQQIQLLGSRVEAALSKALGALETGNLATAGLVIESDLVIDGLRTAIEEHTIRLLTMQQPLDGCDLRYLTSVLSIAGGLERMGDGAGGIARIMLRMVPLHSSTPQVVVHTPSSGGEAEITEPSLMRDLIELGREALRVLHGTMEAFTERDAKAARYIWEEDDVVDVRYHLVRHDLMAMMAGAHAIPALQRDLFVLQRVTYLLWIAHKLERVGDHCGNICKRIVFIIEGETSINRAEREEDQIP